MYNYYSYFNIDNTLLEGLDMSDLAKKKEYSKIMNRIIKMDGILHKGSISDGWHSFDDLYHHRAILFSVIVNSNKDISWKSKLHHDGTMFGQDKPDDNPMFIVGIETPSGQATYHYDINPYWDIFKCKELDRAPEYDGHTPEESIERIKQLGQ